MPRPLCRAAFCPLRVSGKKRACPYCRKHRPVVLCDFPGCSERLRWGNKSGRCKPHWTHRSTRTCSHTGCPRRLDPANKSGKCTEHYSRNRERRKPRPPPKVEAPVDPRIQRRRERHRLWRKSRFLGPPCTGSGCSNLLRSPPTGKLPPLCMECRIATGQTLKALQSGPRVIPKRGAMGMFLSSRD